MHKKIVRSGERQFDQFRSITISHNMFGYAAGSVLLEFGNTKVLCSVSMQSGVPPFLRGKQQGWLTAEYAMLPSSTATRATRESSSVKKNGRSVEISRFIGRSLRTVVDFSILGERTIIIDCDVLQADGGTRTASITGAYLALELAQNRWLQSKMITHPFLTDRLAAFSIAVSNNELIIDPNFKEDSEADADFNFVVSKSGKLIEVQGGAEKEPLSWDLFEQMILLVKSSSQKLFSHLEIKTKYVGSNQKINSIHTQKSFDDEQPQKAPLFSLLNRHQKNTT